VNLAYTVHAMDVHSSWVPKTEEEKDRVRRQMERLLETAHFKNSRRYPALFRFIVEETLEGRGEFLKERLLGVRVFNRPPDYDTADDPIARVTIAEIRKRIAQYYHEEAHESEMRIELMPGHYEPEFFPRKPRASPPIDPSKPSEGVALTLAQDTDTPVDLATQKTDKPRFSLLRSWISAVVVLCLTVACALLWRLERPSALDELWNPVLTPHLTLTFCLPSKDVEGSQIAAAAGILLYTAPAKSKSVEPLAVFSDKTSPSFHDYEQNGQNVDFSDVLATMRISNWIATRGGEQRLRLVKSTTLGDLREGPTILIGGLDNEWTLRALAHMRYQFRATDQEQYWITDTKNPGSRTWEVDAKTQYSAVKRDFALIARVHDDSTREIQVVVAGIGMSGTAAAGEFMVDPNRLEELLKRVGAGFRDHDFEAVLGTDVVNGIPGSATILAVEVW
jgi:hypothetical protein